MRSLLLTLFLSSAAIMAKAQRYYICYRCDDNPKLRMSITFEDEKALSVQYAGQKASMPLRFRRDLTRKGDRGITTEYAEMVAGKVNGVYVLTHVGAWDYAEYRRGKDGKVFRFSIDHDATIVDGAYRTTPCR